MSKLEKQAAKQSKDGQTRYVVYVPDQGGDVFDAGQMKQWGELVMVEAAYLNGKKIA